MNIFVLDRDIHRCARYHCDRHVSKMILESAQILCTALHKKGYRVPYKPTHMRHPCVLWAEESYGNFRWLRDLALALNEEFKFRYEREADHASARVIVQLDEMVYPDGGLTEFVQAMPNQYRFRGNPVRAYRAYYRGEKARFAVWTKRPVPRWMTGR